MTTINEAILDTLRTKEGKEPRHRELLESLGYEVSKGWDYWKVDGVQLRNHGKLETFVGDGLVCGLDSLRKVDWRDHFEKKAERRGGGSRDDQSIYASDPYRYEIGNREVAAYRRLKADADGKSHRTDIEWRKRLVRKAEENLEAAQRNLDMEREMLADAEWRMAEAKEELSAMLTARGIR